MSRRPCEYRTEPLAPHEDMSSYTGLFLDDASEQIAMLEQGLLSLELDASGEILNEIFRAAHSLKAASAGPAPQFQHAVPGASVRLAVHEACQCGLQAYEVTVGIAHDCAMRSVRALLVLQAMETIGSVLFTTPGEEQIESEDFDFD